MSPITRTFGKIGHWTATRVAAAAASTLLAAAPIQAVDTTVTFSSTIAGVCSLLVSTSGVMAPNIGYSNLSSENLTGIPALVTAVTTSGGYEINAIAPGAFTSAPSGGDTDVTFAADYSGLGTTIVPETDGATPTPLNFGLTALTVDLTATKSSGTFPAGSYAADVIVRCE